MINFLKYQIIYAVSSTFVILIGLISIFTFGYKYSIDFVGGAVIEYQSPKVLTEKTVREILKTEGVEVYDITIKGETLTLRAKPLDSQKEQKLKSRLEERSGLVITRLRFENVGPSIGKESVNKTLTASLLAVIGILIFMSISFKSWKFAVAAIIALVHDLLVMLGVYSIMSLVWGAEFDTLFVTALLTTMSFSVHDTIVIFDKIREYRRSENLSFEDLTNKALTQTFIRSINNSMTIVFMLLALVLMGGTTIKFFVAALLVGTITGTYSSPFVASPILVWLEKRKMS